MKRYRNYRIVRKYIKSDFIRYGGRRSTIRILLRGFLAVNHCFAYSFWSRLAKVNGLIYPLAKFMHRRLSRKYGIQIPLDTEIGYGFYIGHGMGLIINPSSKIGNNVNVSQFTTIGTHRLAAEINDNVYIGPSVCIVNNVKIGENVTIGAGSIVVKSIPDGATVAGSPAKILNFNNPGRFVNNRFEFNI